MTDSADPIPRITAADPVASSGDVVVGNIAALTQLFPAVLADGKVNFDVLRQLLGDMAWFKARLHVELGKAGLTFPGQMMAP